MKNRLAYALAVPLMFAALPAAADDTVLFSCTTAKGQPVEIRGSSGKSEDGQQQLNYRVGKQTFRTEAVYSRCTGKNGNSRQTLDAEHEGTAYRLLVEDSTKRPNARATLRIGADGAKSGKGTRTLVCRPGTIRADALSGLGSVSSPCD
ncbi:hypothetical protein [Neisseria bacilliformis]|uniref:hypothetical protein n=1 Tax=Neisseria bacilliformis TaxID=267212 RepID=UPI0028E6D66A|nr:hypothetical protein [Neisseria bacilliformis]